MGQQQLLLLVIALVITGVGIVVGFTMFHNAADASQVDAVTQECISMAARAQMYYMTPGYRGGGGYSFSGITIEKVLPASVNYPAGENEHGIFTITPNGADALITGRPRRSTASNRVVTLKVTPSMITTSIAE